MFLVDWFNGVVASLGLRHKEAKVLFLGLDNACKTILLHVLNDEKLVRLQPTEPPKSEEPSLRKIKFTAAGLEAHQIADRVWKDYFVKGGLLPELAQNRSSGKLTVGNVKFKAFDLGGHKIVNRILKDYDFKVDAVVYLANSFDEETFAESREELHALLTNQSLANVPFLILGFHVRFYHFYSSSVNELVKHLDLANFTTGKGKLNLADSGFRPLEH